MQENELRGNEFFGGESFWYLRHCGNGFSLLDVVNECRPLREKHLAYIRSRYEALKLEASTGAQK